jgi:hypothetical protein
LKADQYQTPDKARLYLMKEYVHGWCSMDTNHVGVEEYSYGTKVTCSEFRKMFLSFITAKEIIDKEEFCVV